MCLGLTMTKTGDFGAHVQIFKESGDPGKGERGGWFGPEERNEGEGDQGGRLVKLECLLLSLK